MHDPWLADASSWSGEITATMMTEALRHGGRLGSDGQVTAVRSGPIGGFGLIGRVDRVCLDYSGEAGAAPASVIVKRPSLNLTDSRALALTEARFYRERISRSAGIHSPEIYCCAIDEERETCLLLLEDLGDDGFIRQLRGCTAQHAALALAEISRLHGLWWNREPPPSLDWLRAPIDTDAFRFCRRWLRAYEGDWPEALGEIPRRLVSSLDALAEQLSCPPRTLVHGDFHCQNMAFSSAWANPAVTFIDFQLAQRATAMLDVARFLATSLATSARREVETDLLGRYHDHLASHGVTGYGPTESTHDLRLALLWNLVMPLTLHVREILTQGAQWKEELPILQRCVRAIEDWDALSAL